MEAACETLRTHSRYIRDNLLPLVTRGGGESRLNSRDITLLNSALSEVNAIPITLDLLRYSRIEKALGTIALDGRWPLETVANAQLILKKWEKQFGSVDDLQADLWSPGGRLEGLKKVKGWSDSTMDKTKHIGSSWSMETGYDLSKAFAVGHLGFAIGAWWIKAAAATRDGIIGVDSKSVTAGNNEAYAVLLRDGSESQIGEDDVMRYTTSSVDRGILKLLKPTSSDRRPVVRVLRSFKLMSPLAPAAGVRYDGLYRVLGYGVKLTKNSEGEDVWTYTFNMQREKGQPSIREALCHPTADELDDYRDYQRAKADKEVPEETQKSNSPLWSAQDEVERHDNDCQGANTLERLGSRGAVDGKEETKMADVGSS